MVRNCSEKEIEDNIEPAKATGNLYGAVDVLVAGHGSDASGNVTIELVINGAQYTAVWGDVKDMWAPCPSSLQSDAVPDNPGPPPVVGSAGKLYLSETWLKDHAVVAAPKWPPRLGPPLPPTARLELYPLKLELVALEMKSGEFVKCTIDLLDPAHAEPTQTIALDGRSPITLRLGSTIFEQAMLPFIPDVKKS